MGEIITFVDADIFVWNGWYEALYKTFTSSDKIGVAGAKLINPLTNRIIDYGIMYSKYGAAHTMMGLLHSRIILWQRSRIDDAYKNCVQCNYDDYQNFVSKNWRNG
ncbi:MAG: hypothetical protein ACLUGQ_08365 [Coprococcus sp.]